MACSQHLTGRQALETMWSDPSSNHDQTTDTSLAWLPGEKECLWDIMDTMQILNCCCPNSVWQETHHHANVSLGLVVNGVVENNVHAPSMYFVNGLRYMSALAHIMSNIAQYILRMACSSYFAPSRNRAKVWLEDCQV